jgi:hypothetical protein
MAAGQLAADPSWDLARIYAFALDKKQNMERISRIKPVKVIERMNLFSIIILIAIAGLILIESRIPVWAIGKNQAEKSPR